MTVILLAELLPVSRPDPPKPLSSGQIQFRIYENPEDLDMGKVLEYLI